MGGLKKIDATYLVNQIGDMKTAATLQPLPCHLTGNL